MADDKKNDAKKPASGSGAFGSWHPVEAIIALVFLLSIVGGLAKNIGNFATSSELSFYGIPLSSFKSFFGGNALIFKILSFTISGISLAGVIILSNMKGAIITAQKMALTPKPAAPTSTISPSPGRIYEINELQQRWENIMKNVSLESESSWRIAIIEADVILDELLDKLGLPGNTMSDKLKAVEKSDFNTIDLAWEGHKVRNMIAHEGVNFRLNQREARLIISLYEAVFKEFYLI